MNFTDEIAAMIAESNNEPAGSPRKLSPSLIRCLDRMATQKVHTAGFRTALIECVAVMVNELIELERRTQ